MNFLLFLIVAAAALAVFRTVSLEKSKKQQEFLKGVVPATLPNGFQRGSVGGYAGGWIGKEFDATTATGINVFEKKGERTKRYPFRIYPAKALRDGGKDVLRIDYSARENPFYVRPITDEIVEVGPGHYVGKAHVRVVPGFPFTVTFFELRTGSDVGTPVNTPSPVVDVDLSPLPVV